MKSPRLIILMGSFCGLLSTAQAQIKTKTALPIPRYQFYLNVGSSNNADDVSETSENMAFGGLGLTINLTRYLYLTADMQMMGETFDMNSHRERPLSASAETPLTMPLVRLRPSKYYETSTGRDILAASVIKLTSTTGIHRRQHYTISGGYQRIFPRNLLRVGAGMTYWRSYSRNISSPNYPLYAYSNNITHLLIRDMQAFAPSFEASYDFFLLKNLTVGIKANTIMVREWGPTGSQIGISVGYTPSQMLTVRKKEIKGV
jgi:hypothetical protein